MVPAMNAPARIEWSEARFGSDTQHWLPRNPDSVLDHIPGQDGLPILGNTLDQLRDYRNNSRSEEHTSELQSLMRISYAVFCLKKKKTTTKTRIQENTT